MSFVLLSSIGALLAIGVDWASLSQFKILVSAIWRPREEYEYRLHAFPRALGIASGGATIGCGIAMDYNAVIVIGAGIFLAFHLSQFPKVIGESDIAN